MFGIYARILRPEDEVVARGCKAQAAQTKFFNLFGGEVIGQLEVIKANEVAIFHVAGVYQSVVGYSESGVHGTRNFGYLAILSPTVRYRGALVVVASH